MSKHMATTAFDELAQYLAEAETWSYRLPQANAAQIVSVITALDHAQATIDALIESGARHPSEEIQRIEVIASALRKHGSKVVRTLAREGVSLHAVAAEQAELPDAWWWHLPEIQRAQQRQRISRLVTTFAVMALIVVLVLVLMNTVFAPDPLVMARVDAMDAAQNALIDGEPAVALEALDAGLAKIALLLDARDADADEEPFDTTELWVWRGVALEELGRPEDAAASYVEAEAQDAIVMLFSRVVAYRVTGRLDAALDDALALVARAPENPGAYLLLGDVYQDHNKIMAAAQAYQQAADLALETPGHEEVYVLAKQRIAHMQQAQMMPPVDRDDDATEQP